MKLLKLLKLSGNVICLLVLCCGLISCAGDPEVVEELIRPVRYELVLSTGGTRVRTFSGTSQAAVESRLSFKVAGTLDQLSVRVGDQVVAGDLIAELDSNDYRLQVNEAQASLAQAQAQQRNAESSYERVQTLYENRTASKQELDGARAASESAAAQVRVIVNRLELAKLQVGYTRMTAPFDGSIAAVEVETNENLLAGKPVVVLNAGGPREVRVSVPEMLIAQIQLGDKVEVTFNSLPENRLSATVNEVGLAASEFATTFPVTVSLDESPAHVMPGMAAEVAFVFETAGTRECMIVPPSAVSEDRVGRFVYIIEPIGDEFGLARRKDVTIGDITAEGLEILTGVVEGELVITAGVSRIKDGQKVELL